MDGVSCAGVADCWAVGWATDLNYTLPLTTPGPGGGWTLVPGASQPQGQYGMLQGVDCMGPSDCWAVGWLPSGSGLIEHYDGGDWSVVPSPSLLSGASPFLAGVSCSGPYACWAVGDSWVYGGGDIAYQPTWTAPLIEQYAGGSWSIVSAPPPDASDGLLSGATCVSAVDCWAVGGIAGSGGGEEPLIEQYADGVWSVVTGPEQAGGGARLNSVSCTGPDRCWAVGGTDQDHGLPGAAPFATQSLIEEYDGSDWRVVPSPSPPGSEWSQLTGVACAGVAHCWSVGFSIPAHQGTGPLIEEYTGSGWHVVSGPTPPGAAGTQLNGVACASTGECFAVGGITEMATNSSSPAFVEET